MNHVTVKRSNLFQDESSRSTYSEGLDGSDTTSNFPVKDGGETHDGRISASHINKNEYKDEHENDYIRKCLFCNMNIKTYIPHLKGAKNTLCLKFYLDRYNISGDSPKQKLSDLGKQIKLEEQRRKRTIPMHKETMYKKRNEVRNKDKTDVPNLVKQ